MAGRHFPDAPDLLVLRFEAAALAPALRWVRSEPDRAPFPHLHAPLPATAVRDVRPLTEALRDLPG